MVGRRLNTISSGLLSLLTGSITKYKNQQEMAIVPACLRTPGEEIDNKELKSCINYFKGKGNQQCGAEQPNKLCELRNTVVIVTTRQLTGYTSVNCKEVVKAMQWVADKCTNFGGMCSWNQAHD